MRHGHKRNCPRFWQEWEDREETASPDTPPGFRQRMAWRKHFQEFLGMPPEEHWLFSGRRFRHWADGSWGPPGKFNPFVGLVLSKGGGLLALVVLHLLEEKPRYGNDIMREIESLTQERWGSNPGAIYPMLAVMEDQGLVVGEWEDEARRTRRIYQLTGDGKDELVRLKEVMRPKLEEAARILDELNQVLAE